jgi:gamma-aminobutyric acid receptor subunit beta
MTILFIDGYSNEHIVFEWEITSDDGMGFVPDNLKTLPQYKVTGVKLSTLHNKYVVGK